MVSGFVCDCYGFLSAPVAVAGQPDIKSCKLFKAGKHRDGWFTNDDLVAQLQLASPLFEERHPGCQLVFAFDNSMSHHKRAPDGLDAYLLPLKDNGKNVPSMRATTFINTLGEVEQQSMQYTDDGGNVVRKGVKRVLMERGKWRNGMNLDCRSCVNKVPHNDREDDGFSSKTTQCCAHYCLSQEPDFLAQQEWLTEITTTRGHDIIFYPKFHCELNAIEMVWAYLKSYFRRNCPRDFDDLINRIPG